MPLLTFDQPGPQGIEIDDLKSPIPDEIDCGENNKFWVKVYRKQRIMVLIDKVNGKTLKKETIDQPQFRRIAASHGVGPRQIGAVLAALELK